ncbi:MAG: DUF177 domain-containing protein [Anaerolineales bacterium]|nr:DUF177 domain-containing protein [Anaerolineales bacterium]
MPHSSNPLRLNVGFIVNLSVGDSREFIFDVPALHLDSDFTFMDLSGVARITRTAQGLLVQVKLSALAECDCVRCLTPFSQSLKTEFTELYAFSRDSMTDSGLILPEDAHIDFAPIIREYMLLEVPMSPLCRPDCKGLCPICGENLNETKCNHEEDTIDPRLAILKSLLDKSDIN